jgi:type I restriction enzyme M protein
MSAQSRPLVNKLWALCGVLRDGGITYQDYLTELSWLLYLRFSTLNATSIEDQRVLRSWSVLVDTPPRTLIDTYTRILDDLRLSVDATTAAIFVDAKTRITDPHVLAMLITAINEIDWGQLSIQALGDIYEGILERNVQEQKSGAGQYFTPRSVVELMVRAISPKKGEIVQDPAAGTGGFLVSAATHALHGGSGPLTSLPSHERQPSYFGVELVPGAFRLCLMNLSLHSVPSKVVLGNSLSWLGTTLPRPDIILTNPPFGSRRGADRVERDDLTFRTSNKQLAFLQHVYRTLKPGGRAAIVVPDGILFDSGIGRSVRQEMMRICDVHTILRLPVGLFYAQAIKTNVLFLRKPHALTRDEDDATTRTWIYDARTETSARTQAAKTAAVFADFERIYTLNEGERAQIADNHPRFTSFTRAELRDYNDQLDLGINPPRSVQTHNGHDPAKSLHAIKLALMEALDLVDQLEANLFSDRSDYET